MKINTECIPCIFERAKLECDLAFTDEKEKIETLAEIARYVGANLNPDVIPAKLGTERFRIIERRSRKEDPYSELKKGSNRVAKELMPLVQKFYDSHEDKIFALIKIAAAANTMEFGVKGHDFDNDSFKMEMQRVLDEELVGDIEKIHDILEKFDKVLYLTDNCGEVVFDIFIAEKFREMGKDVVISPKNEPIINDATLEDIKDLNINGFKIVPSGSYVGLSLDEAPQEFLDFFWNKKYLIFAKGMGYYETLSEFDEKLKGRLLYVFRAKCSSVSQSIGVKRGKLVARAV
ncbi:MAG: ARMT1-like domain-containing protein [Thermodesulfobacteriota bacterium]